MWHNIDVGGWPVAVRSAELARGTLVACGPGVRLVSWPETAEARAYAATQAIGDQLMPVMMAAAWVWGCARDPGLPFLCSTRGRARPKLQYSPELHVHEYRYAGSDLEACGEVTLPSPARTACDLVRLSAELSATTVITIRLLLLRAGLSREEWRHELMRGPGRSRVRALQRLEELSS
ncbi:hypothetical protein [Leucobacter salsicius]|uniref:hypothetical protein n=1 Tax=Leucobacter salsicius TaxID=664638 RepID=UPI0003466F13|nr:hypothetical protein [Leucobacter salsicius]